LRVPEFASPVDSDFSRRVRPNRREQSASTISTYGVSFANSDENTSPNLIRRISGGNFFIFHVAAAYLSKNSEYSHDMRRQLGISGIDTGVYSLRVPQDADGNSGAQIDLLLDRADNIVNVCEMKFAKEPFAIDGECERSLRNKISACKRYFGGRKSIHATMVTTFGLRPGIHSEIVQSEISLEGLFAF